MSTHTASEAVLIGARDALDVSGFTSLAPVGNGVPTGSAFPYSHLTARERRFDTFGLRGKEVDLRLHVYSEYQGDQQILRIIDKAVELLDDERGVAIKMSAPGYTVLQVLYEGDMSLPDENIAGVQVRHRAGLFRVTVEVAS